MISDNTRILPCFATSIACVSTKISSWSHSYLWTLLSVSPIKYNSCIDSKIRSYICSQYRGSDRIHQRILWSKWGYNLNLKITMNEQIDLKPPFFWTFCGRPFQYLWIRRWFVRVLYSFKVHGWRIIKPDNW